MTLSDKMEWCDSCSSSGTTKSIRSEDVKAFIKKIIISIENIKSEGLDKELMRLVIFILIEIIKTEAGEDLI